MIRKVISTDLLLIRSMVFFNNTLYFEKSESEFALSNKEKITFPASTAIGALSSYISDISVKNFQPMNANFGLFTNVDTSIRDKRTRNTDISQKSIESVRKIFENVKNW